MRTYKAVNSQHCDSPTTLQLFTCVNDHITIHLQVYVAKEQTITLDLPVPLDGDRHPGELAFKPFGVISAKSIFTPTSFGCSA